MPGLLIGALRFGHLPAILVPAGPMPSGLANKEKRRIRELYAEGKVGRAELLDAEAASYHGAGTCTFYGTANSNQMMMEVMGLHIPGAAFINPGTRLRQELTRAAVHQLVKIGWDGNDYRPLGRVVDERGDRQRRRRPARDRRIDQPCDPPAGDRARRRNIDRLGGFRPAVGGGAADRADLSERFGRREPVRGSGGMAFTIATLLDAGLLHRDIMTVGGDDLGDYAARAEAARREAGMEDAPAASLDETMLRPVSNPFNADGGMRLVARQSRPRDLQDQRGRPVPLDDRGPCPDLLRSG